MKNEIRNEIVGWKWVTRERRPIIWPLSHTHPPYEVGVWIKRRPGAGPFTVFHWSVDACQYGAQLGRWAVGLDLWEVRWTPCYSLDGPNGIDGPIALWCAESGLEGEALRRLPTGTCLANEFKLVEQVPESAVVRGLVAAAREARRVWSHRLDFWLKEAEQRYWNEYEKNRIEHR
jgi:hypothetical protein